MSKEFEQFLIDEKEYFCKWQCKYNKLNILKELVDLDLPCDCDSCEIVDVCEYNDANEIQIDIDLCGHCKLDDFIKEIRDRIDL